MRKSAPYLPLLLALIAGCQSEDSLSPTGVARTSRAPDPGGVAQETFVDYAKPAVAGGGLTVTTESADFNLFYGGARWFSGDQVDYTIEEASRSLGPTRRSQPEWPPSTASSRLVALR
jgi:hypothetical protein